MAPQPMTPAQRNALKARFARMFDPAARRAPVRLAAPPPGEADAFISPAALPPPGEADAFINPPAAPILPPAAPINIGAPVLPPARPQLSGFMPYRGDASGTAGVGAIEQGYQRDLAAQVPVRKVTIGAPPPPAPPTLPGPDSRPPGAGPPSDIVKMTDKQTTVQGVSGIKVPPEVERLQNEAHAAELQAAEDTKLAAQEQARAQQQSQADIEAAYQPQFGALEEQAAQLRQEMEQARARQVELDRQAAEARAVDPNRLWSNQTALQRGMLTAASIFGGALEGFTAGRVRNDIPERIERMAARDTDLQIKQWEMAKSDAEAQATTVGKLVSIYGSLGAARGQLMKAKLADVAAAAARIAEGTTDAGARAKGALLKAAADKALAKTMLDNAKSAQGEKTFTQVTGSRDQFTPGAGKGPGEGQGALKQGELTELSSLDRGIAYAATQAPIVLGQLTNSTAKTFGDYITASIGTFKGNKAAEQRQQAIDRWTFKIVMGMGEPGSGAHFSPKEFAAAGGEVPQAGDTVEVAARKIYNAFNIIGTMLLRKAEDKALGGDRIAAEMYSSRVRSVGKIVEGLETNFFKGAYARDAKQSNRGPQVMPWAPGVIEGRLADAERRRAQLLGGR